MNNRRPVEKLFSEQEIEELEAIDQQLSQHVDDDFKVINYENPDIIAEILRDKEKLLRVRTKLAQVPGKAQKLERDIRVQEACHKLHETYNFIATQMLQQNNFKVAYELLKKAEGIGGSPTVQAITCNNLACYFWRIGKLKTAVSYLEKALAFEEKNKESDVSQIHLNLCATLSQLNKHDRAIRHAHIAIIKIFEMLLPDLTKPMNANEVQTIQERIAVFCIAYHNCAVEEEFLKLPGSIDTYKQGLAFGLKYLGPTHHICTILRRSLETAIQSKPEQDFTQGANTSFGKGDRSNENGMGQTRSMEEEEITTERRESNTLFMDKSLIASEISCDPTMETMEKSTNGLKLPDINNPFNVPSSPSKMKGGADDLPSLNQKTPRAKFNLSTENIKDVIKALESPDKLLEYAQNSFGDLRGQDATQMLQEMYNYVATQMLQQNNFKFAFELLKKAEIIKGSDLLKAVTYNNIACYYRRTGKLRIATKYLHKALAVEQSNKDADVSQTHLNLCATLSQLNKHELAMRHAHIAIIKVYEMLLPELISRVRNNSIIQERVAVLCIAYHNLAVEEEFLNFSNSVETYKSGLRYGLTFLGPEHHICTILKRSIEAVQNTATQQTEVVKVMGGRKIIKGKQPVSAR